MPEPQLPTGPIVVRVQRWALVLGLGTFLLPFLTVRNCSGSEERVIHGLQLFSVTDGMIHGAWVLVPVVIALALVGLTFRERDASPARTTFDASWRAIATALGGVCGIMLPFGAMPLFDNVEPHVGYVLYLVLWLTAVVAAWIAALRLFNFTMKGAKDGLDPDAPNALFKPVFRFTAVLVVFTTVVAAVIAPIDVVELALSGLALVTFGAPAVWALESCGLGVARNESWALWGGLGTGTLFVVVCGFALAAAASG